VYNRETTGRSSNVTATCRAAILVRLGGAGDCGARGTSASAAQAHCTTIRDMRDMAPMSTGATGIATADDAAYSLSALIGSTRVARSAGISVASTPAAPTTATITT
jgi:hypothetical protein